MYRALCMYTNISLISYIANVSNYEYICTRICTYYECDTDTPYHTTRYHRERAFCISRFGELFQRVIYSFFCVKSLFSILYEWRVRTNGDSDEGKGRWQIGINHHIVQGWCSMYSCLFQGLGNLITVRFFNCTSRRTGHTVVNFSNDKRITDLGSRCSRKKNHE